MLTGELSPIDHRPSGRGSPPAPTGELAADAAALYGDLRASPFLRQLLARTSRLLGTCAGSISMVDARAGRYHKVAELGALCQLGHSFPLDEGVTGQVVSRRRAVVLAHYADVRSGHLPVGHPAYAGSVVAVPIWWRGDVIGVNVAFAGAIRRFGVEEVDRLELLTHLAAPGIVRTGASDPTLAPLLRSVRRPQEPADPTPEPPPGSRVADAAAVGEQHGRPATSFTVREGQVLTLLARGASDRAVAEALVISSRTVEKHVASLLRKTGTRSRTAAVMRCVDEGWLPA